MLKLLGMVMVAGSCTAIGLFMAEEKKHRLRSLRELKSFFITLQGEIRYGGTPLNEAIEGAAVGTGEIAAGFLEIAAAMERKDTGSFFEIWKLQLRKSGKNLALSKLDMEKLLRVGETLGYLDRETQLACLELYLLELEKDLAIEEGKIGETVRLCRWLGTLAGVFICILMI